MLIKNSSHTKSIFLACDEPAENVSSLDEAFLPNEPRATDKSFIQELSAENIEELTLLDERGSGTTFKDLYEYKHFLGRGGFGYVVQAVDKESG